MTEDKAGAPDQGEQSLRPWTILVADDEADVHSVTKMALAERKFFGRPVEFLHAYSHAEACALLQKRPDIALAFIDVVMETEDAGLRTVRFIREELNNPLVRIVLRSGQPGNIEDVVVRYDIDDYREKTELTKMRLFIVVQTALRTYQVLLAQENYIDRLGDMVSELKHFNAVVMHDIREPLDRIATHTQIIESFWQKMLDDTGTDR